MKAWKTIFKANVDAFVAKHKKVDIVLSPDWDGILSTVLLHHYVRRTHSHVPVQIVGTYDCKQIVTLGKEQSVEEALFLDLDLPMDGVCHIGQHLLGYIPLSNDLSFNPNSFFQNYETWTKYPFGTAQMVFYGLFDECDFPPVAETLLAHADSSHANAKKYRPNCKQWVDKMYKGKSYMENLVNGTYFEHGLKEHLVLVEFLEPHVMLKKKYIGKQDGWDKCQSRQTVKGKDEVHMIRNMHLLLDFAAVCLKVDCPALAGKPSTARCIWSGRRKMVPLGEANSCDGGMQAYLKKKHAKSHAVVSSRILSFTMPPLEELDIKS
tara:strand:- start:144 stop:1109 length:966 start_codon:yes stop_codon:yes gene_type:complete